MVDKTVVYMNRRGFESRYDHLQLAGASLGPLAEGYPAWRQTFWQHLEFLLEHRGIELVVILDHRDCKAYETILGRNFSKQAAAEKAAHVSKLLKLKVQIHEKYPGMEVELGLMALDGSVENVG